MPRVSIHTADHVYSHYGDLYYEKAFDKVPHRRLTNKVASFGLLSMITEWIKAF